MSQQFIRVPPDSTGKRISHVAEIDITFNGNVASSIHYGDNVVGGTSGFKASVARVNFNGAVTEVSLVIDDHSPSDVPTVGENVLVGVVVIGVISTVGHSHYLQRNVLASGDNPYRVAKVNEYGQLSVQSGGGDAFGRQVVAGTHTIRNYQFNLSNSDFFQEVLQNGGTKLHSPEYSAMTLTASTAASSTACMTSNIYHYYTPGVSQQILMTVALGDSGKANNRRQWGYMDNDDGVFFELNGTTLNVVLRRSVEGTIQEIRIPQAEWNENRVNGEGGTFNQNGFSIDLTKDNIFWIDFQWLGAGSIRFGVYINGAQVVCHQMNNSNTFSRPYMRSGTLPVKFCSINSGVTAGASSITAFCITVQSSSPLSPSIRSFGRLHVGLEQAVSDTNRFVISSMRMKQTFKGRPNHSLGIPVTFSLYAKDHPIVFEIVKNGTLTGAPTETPWSRNPSEDSSVEFDYAYDGISGGNVIISRIVAPNQVDDIDMTEQFGLTKELLFRHADTSTYDIYSFCVRTLYPLVTADAWIALEWNELQIN